MSRGKHPHPLRSNPTARRPLFRFSSLALSRRLNTRYSPDDSDTCPLLSPDIDSSEIPPDLDLKNHSNSSSSNVLTKHLKLSKRHSRSIAASGRSLPAPIASSPATRNVPTLIVTGPDLTVTLLENPGGVMLDLAMAVTSKNAKKAQSRAKGELKGIVARVGGLVRKGAVRRRRRRTGCEKI